MQRTLAWMLIGILSVSLAACGGGGAAPATDTPAAAAGDAANGQVLFTSTCSACHGPAGTGIAGLGKDLTTSTFAAEKTDVELIEFIRTGRPASDPLNTTGIDMPPRGGNPALTDDDLADIVSFLRSIHQ